MTLPAFGRAVPIHCAILSLAGYDLFEYPAQFVGDEMQRITTMRDGLEELIDDTEVDFGFDLAAWRELLLTFDEFGYRHPYSFRGVDHAIVAAMADPEFPRLAELAMAGRDEWEASYLARRARRRARQAALKNSPVDLSPRNDSDSFIRAIRAHLDMMGQEDE